MSADCFFLLFIFFGPDQGEAAAAEREEEGDDVQVGRQMGLAAAP